MLLQSRGVGVLGTQQSHWQGGAMVLSGNHLFACVCWESGVMCTCMCESGKCHLLIGDNKSDDLPLNAVLTIM